MKAEDGNANQQLGLSLDGDLESGRPDLPARLGLPVAGAGHSPFDDDGYFFEPWWPGAHALLRRDRDRVAISTEHLADPLQAFPELRSAIEHLAADGVFVEGTLLALDAEGRPDERLLRRRLGAQGRPTEVAEGAFVATDLPYLEGQSLARMPFVERRRRLATVLGDSDHCVLGRGLVGEGRMLGRAVASLGLSAISARRLDAQWKHGPSGHAWLRLPVVETPAPETRPFLILMERLPLGD
jgi:bifunctional non-homologous end joining protein LigD